MGADSRQNALEAAIGFLDQEREDNTKAAIFSLDFRMNVTCGFTNDRAALGSAVRPALNGSAAELATPSANVLSETDYSITSGPGGVSLNILDGWEWPEDGRRPASKRW